MTKAVKLYDLSLSISILHVSPLSFNIVTADISLAVHCCCWMLKFSDVSSPHFTKQGWANELKCKLCGVCKKFVWICQRPWFACSCSWASVCCRLHIRWYLPEPVLRWCIWRMKLMMVGVEMSRSRYRHAAAASRSYIVCLHLTFIDLMLVLKNCLLYYTFVVFLWLQWYR